MATPLAPHPPNPGAATVQRASENVGKAMDTMQKSKRSLFNQLLKTDQESFRNYMRMDFAAFKQLLSMIENVVLKKDTVMRSQGQLQTPCDWLNAGFCRPATSERMCMHILSDLPSGKKTGFSHRLACRPALSAGDASLVYILHEILSGTLARDSGTACRTANR